MDNKKWYKRISTCFWFLLATMMFWLPIIITIFSFFIHNENNIEFNEVSLNGVYEYGLHVLDNFLNSTFGGDRFELMSLPFIYDMFYNLFELLGFDLEYSYTLWSCVSLSWFVTVYFFELLVDFMVWLPRWCHAMLSKGVGKVD